MLFDDDKFSCDVNIKSIQEVRNILFKIWALLFMIWWKSKLDVKMSTFDPSMFVLSLEHHKFDFALKSPRTTIKYGVLLALWSKSNSKLS